LGLETHFLFSSEGQLVAEATPSGDLQKQYIYLAGEPLAQVVLQDGVGSRPIPLARGCSSVPYESDGPWLLFVALAVLAGSSRRVAQRAAVLIVLVMGIESCKFEDDFRPSRTPSTTSTMTDSELRSG
jgi:hypothetical protein